MSSLEIREGEYGDKVLALEPGGIESIPTKDRHGKARNLFATWVSPNMEFATIYVGALAVIAFGLSFKQAIAGILLGNFLGGLGQYFLTQDGPKYGVPQMIIGRAAFESLEILFLRFSMLVLLVLVGSLLIVFQEPLHFQR